MDLNRFSQNAREVLDVATAVVRRGINQLGTEHVLLGLLAQQGAWCTASSRSWAWISASPRPRRTTP